MADQFAIQATCLRCGESDLLASEEDKARPVLFDTPEEAMTQASSLSKKQAGTFKSIGKDPLYECPNPECGVISRMYDLQFDVVRYQTEA